jgi:hypothetical protein
MMYIQNIYHVGNAIEVEKVHSGRYGKRVAVSEKIKPTSEAMEKVNRRKRETKLRRLIQNNFTGEDWHLVLTYRKDKRPDVEQAKDILKSFHAKMKRRYQKSGEEYKWICVTEYRTAAIHHHLVINNTKDLMKILRECWPHGHVNLTPLDENGDVLELAQYLLKETRDTKRKSKYNLKQPPSISEEQKCGASKESHYGSGCKKVA